jgi:hypothetical protein
MQQVLWETVFEKQFNEILNKYGIDKSDHDTVNFLRQQINITKSAGCVLMIEVAEDWKERLIRIIEQRQEIGLKPELQKNK